MFQGFEAAYRLATVQSPAMPRLSGQMAMTAVFLIPNYNFKICKKSK